MAAVAAAVTVFRHFTHVLFCRRALGWRRGAGASLTPTTTGEVETGEQLLSREHSSSRDGDAAAGSSAAAAGNADGAAAPSARPHPAARYMKRRAHLPTPLRTPAWRASSALLRRGVGGIELCVSRASARRSCDGLGSCYDSRALLPRTL